MQQVKINDFDTIVTGRRSIREYDPSVKISKEEMTEILQQAMLAPSSLNLQPWRFLVIDTPEGKEKLGPLAMFNKRQVETSSAVIAVFVDMNSSEYIEPIYSKAVEQGLMPEDVKEKQAAAYKEMLGALPEEKLREMNLIDAGLVSMQLMLVARAHGYDTNPIGGYDKARIAETFGMDSGRYYPVMLVSIGKAANEGRPSVRLEVEDVTRWA